MVVGVGFGVVVRQVAIVASVPKAIVAPAGSEYKLLTGKRCNVSGHNELGLKVVLRIADAGDNHFVLTLHLMYNLPFVVVHVGRVMELFFQPFGCLLGIASVVSLCPFTDEQLESGHDGHGVNGRIEAAIASRLEPTAEEHNLGHVEIPVVTSDELDELSNLPRGNLVTCARKLGDISDHVGEPFLSSAIAIGEIDNCEGRCIGEMASARVARDINHAVNMERCQEAVLVRPSHSGRFQPAVSSMLRHLRTLASYDAARNQCRDRHRTVG